MIPEYKALFVKKLTHLRIKTLAAKKGMTIDEYICSLLKKS